MFYHSPLSLKHLTGPSHPESVKRYITILDTLREHKIPEVQIETPCPLKWLFLCHDRQYVSLVHKICSSLPENQIAQLPTGDVNVSRHSPLAARAVIACALLAADHIIEKKIKRAFILARPPGHHATRSKGMGFCLFNTIAITARYLQRIHNIKRIAIIDWDAHHGNGTASIFENDPSILYTSTHHALAYPGTGQEPTPTNRPILSRDDLLSFYEHDLPPLIDQFKPEIILLSCGFDGHMLDPLVPLGLHTEDFATLTKIVVDLAKAYCSGRILSFLEGGYRLQALADSALAHINASSCN